MKTLLWTLCLGLGLAGCGNSVGAKPDSIELGGLCAIQFAAMDSMRELAVKANQMRVQCRMSEDEILSQL